MKKTTSKNLSNRLLKYGAFSAAMLGVANASGQIVYTDIADETADATNPIISIDIDVDGTGDYLLAINPTDVQLAAIFPANSSMASAYNSNAIVGVSGSSSYFYASNLDAGEQIDGTNTVLTNIRADFNYDSCASAGSQFCDGMDGYVGLHFKIAGNTHYGWARIQVAADATSIILKDFAYNSVPGEAIIAGNTTLQVAQFSVNDIRVVALNKNINLYNLPDSASYNLYATSGQSVMSGKTNDSSYSIEATSMSTGVYILELKDTATNAVIRKKIVL